MKKIKFVFIILLFLLVSCKKETILTSQDNMIPVDIDLQTGTENKHVKVYLNQQLSFQAYLPTSGSLAGPIASFSTFLPSNTKTMRVWWQSSSSSNGLLFKQDSSVFNLSSSKKYYIGIEINNDTLKVVVQDIPFGYM